MAVVINGSGTVTGLAVGGLPDGTVDEGTLAADSVTAAKIPAALENTFVSGRKNLIINGAMQVAQRGTSETGVTASAYHIDRLKSFLTSLGTWTVTQDGSGPSGFANSLKYDCTTADASPAAGDSMFIASRLEGQDLQSLKKGTADAESFTLSFHVKSNKTGTYQVNFYDADNTRIIGGTYTIDAADTWEKKELTFAGDTTGTLDDDNLLSLQIEWWLGSGTNYTSGAVPTSWEAVSDADRNAGGTVNLADSTSNYLNITGIQLELGSTATDFEHRSYGEELALCQRYYFEISGAGKILGTARWYSSTEIDCVMHFPVELRTTPTLISSNNTNDFYFATTSGVNKYFDAWGGSQHFSGDRINLHRTGVSGGTAGYAGSLYLHNSTSKTAFDAEL